MFKSKNVIKIENKVVVINSINLVDGIEKTTEKITETTGCGHGGKIQRFKTTYSFNIMLDGGVLKLAFDLEKEAEEEKERIESTIDEYYAFIGDSQT